MNDTVDRVTDRAACNAPKDDFQCVFLDFTRPSKKTDGGGDGKGDRRCVDEVWVGRKRTEIDACVLE